MDIGSNYFNQDGLVKVIDDDIIRRIECDSDEMLNMRTTCKMMVTDNNDTATAIITTTKRTKHNRSK